MIKLPNPIRAYFNGQVKDQLGYERMKIDFRASPGEEALYPPDSLAWQTYKNPVALFIGGVSAVYMQLADPRVRSGVWEHSSFKDNAVTRIQRTGLAAMMTVYGQKSAAERMITHVNCMHEQVKGTMADGREYNATDPELLNWVFSTANFAFFNAYDRFGPGAPKAKLDEGYRMASERVAGLYGVTQAGTTAEEVEQYLHSRLEELEPHSILDEFTEIVQNAPLLPSYMRPVQSLLARAAASNIPQAIRDQAGLDDSYGLRRGEETVVKALCRLSDKLYLEAHPAVMSCERLGLPADYLFRKSSNDNVEGGAAPGRNGPDTSSDQEIGAPHL